jgi:hypothetical protein
MHGFSSVFLIVAYKDFHVFVLQEAYTKLCCFTSAIEAGFSQTKPRCEQRR